MTDQKISEYKIKICKDKKVSTDESEAGSRRKEISGIRKRIAIELLKGHGVALDEVARRVGFWTTPKDHLLEQQKPQKVGGISPEEMARMEKETEVPSRDFAIVKDSYGKDPLNLVLACGYLSKLLDNSQIVRYLSKLYPDILSEFQQIIEATSLSNK